VRGPEGKRWLRRKQVHELLQRDDFDQQLSGWLNFPARQVINPLLSFLLSMDELVKWRAVKAIGVVMAGMADSDFEGAREIMRRLIWSLNDESGGIGWGSPEAMGEIMARHDRLANDYCCILTSYISENPLENKLLERGVLWGLGRLAQARPGFIPAAASPVAAYLKSTDPVHRAYAVWALGFIGFEDLEQNLEALLADEGEATFYEGGQLLRLRVGELAARTLSSTPA
jgi:HEAT repeat protein